MRKPSFVITALGAALALFGCGEPGSASEAEPVPVSGVEPAAAGSPLQVYVVNYPLQHFAARIGGNAVQVEFPAPADSDPAYWSPDRETVAAYQDADLILLNGAGYAKWVSRVTLPPSRLVDTSAAFRDRYVQVADAPSHSHGPQGEHTHGEVAFTTWLDPALAIEQARAVLEALVAARPGESAAFQERFDSLEADLQGLDRELEEVTGTFREAPVLFSHPVYQYLEHRYGLNGRSVHWEPGEMPDDKAWREFEGLLRSHPARWMIWESHPMDETVLRLESMGVSSIVYEPCGNAPEGGSLLSVLRAGAENLRKIKGG